MAGSPESSHDRELRQLTALLSLVCDRTKCIKMSVIDAFRGSGLHCGAAD
jgi:hypothetical protein